MNEAFWKAIKEPLRLLVLAILPFGIAYFAVLPYSWAVVATVILRWFDKFLHELGKETEKEGWLGIKGLTGF